MYVIRNNSRMFHYDISMLMFSSDVSMISKPQAMDLFGERFLHFTSHSSHEKLSSINH